MLPPRLFAAVWLLLAGLALPAAAQILPETLNDTFYPDREAVNPDLPYHLLDSGPDRPDFNPTGFDSVLAARFQHHIDSLLTRYQIVGISTAVRMPGKGTWVGASGFSDPVNSDPMRTDHLLEIDSNTKAFVAAVLLQMQSEGLLSLDDSLHSYLPAFNHVDSTITIRQLLNHTAGLNDYLNENIPNINNIFNNPTFYWTPEYIISTLFPPNFPAGTNFSYSNTGYVLAGMIVRNVSGTAGFLDPLRQRIVQPLQLANTFLEAEEALVGDLAHGWLDYTGDGVRDDMAALSRIAIMSSFWTAGGIVATAEDLALWLDALHNGQVIDESAYAQMIDYAPLSGRNYGLGMQRFNFDGTWVRGHSGGGFGYNSLSVYDPASGTIVVAMMNQDANGPLWSGDFTFQLFSDVQDYLRRPHDHPWPDSVARGDGYLRPGVDAGYLAARVLNPTGTTTRLEAALASVDGAVRDTVELFDDGAHDDGGAGDGLFAGMVGPYAHEATFVADLVTTDIDSPFVHTLPSAAGFATTGPLVAADYRFTRNALGILLHITLANEGLSGAATGLSARIHVDDPRITDISVATRNFPDIAPGDSAESIGHYYLVSSDQPASFDVTMSISSEGFPIWTDSLTIALTGVTPEPVAVAPERFFLAPNWPNPFNPSTTVQFGVRQAGRVTVAVFDVLGRKVVDLVDDRLQPGQYRVRWNADGLASGVYYLRMRAGEFTQTRKMVLMR